MAELSTYICDAYPLQGMGFVFEAVNRLERGPMNRCCLLIACICCVAPTTLASQTYFVSDRGGGGIVRLQDLNGDGDALDLGEHLP